MKLQDIILLERRHLRGTVAVDSHGDPLVLYHGAKIKGFDTSVGSWFTTDRRASTATDAVPVNIMVRRPATMRDLARARIMAAQGGFDPNTREFNREVIQVLQDAGFDGIHDPAFGVGVWATFDYDQIKKVA